MPTVGNGKLRGVGEIPGGAGSQKIVLSEPHKMRRCFSGIWRAEMREVGAVITGQTGIVVCQVGADQFGMHALKVIIRFSIVRDSKVKITRAHAKW